ncbi:glycosyltransferase [Flavobacterium sp. ZS1P14]|uniref:glycosyltransferase n=1 Tax=Flavobacterium sp. ZS1P14 TaxID=3401729 RepID=UPI003AAE421F
MLNRRIIIISAINFFEGGPLSVLNDCLDFASRSKYQNKYKFIALVHKVDLFLEEEYPNIEFVEYPKSRQSYFYRLYYEYIYFKKFAKENNVSFWFSLHDITPSIGNIPQAVYCHNPSPFNTVNFKDIHIQPTQFFFRLFYRFLYQINIKRNKYVFVQQLWMKNRFVEMFNLDKDKVIVAPPQITNIPSEYLKIKEENKIKTFFFPTFPRPFKNIEVICEAAKLVLEKNKNFRVVITIDGSENKYSESIVKAYKDISTIDFIGLIKREEVYDYYSKVNCLIFPSKLETWGLPISEFKQFNKPMMVADLPYAKETVGRYDFVNFFNIDDPIQLSKLMIDFLGNKSIYDKTNGIKYEQPYVLGWGELFSTLLK